MGLGEAGGRLSGGVKPCQRAGAILWSIWLTVRPKLFCYFSLFRRYAVGDPDSVRGGAGRLALSIRLHHGGSTRDLSLAPIHMYYSSILGYFGLKSLVRNSNIPKHHLLAFFLQPTTVWLFQL